jgi:Flp pilus assembly pilin Flp
MFTRFSTAFRLPDFVRSVLRDRGGAVAIEYGLMVAMIAIALVGILTMSQIAENQSEMYNLLSDTMNR